MPLISVIIPIYNTCKYLQDTINSIISQNITDIEIICFDDGSTDGSLQLLEDLAHTYPCIRVYTQENRGQSVARNNAMLHARGKYIYFMDSDDILKENCFNQCIKAMERYQYDFLFFDADILWETTSSSICWDYHRTNIYEEGIAYNGIELMNSLLDNYTHRAVPWLLFIRHEYICRIKIDFYPNIIHEDELYTTLLTLQSNKVGCLKQSYVLHRVRNNSTMTTHYSRRNVDCYITVTEELMNWGRKHRHIQPLLRKYARYTLDKVFYTAHVLPFKDKIKLTKVMVNKRFTQFVSLKNWIRFYIK